MFNLPNQERKIGFIKRNPWRWRPMMFYVRQNMFVMRMRAGEFRDMWMLKRIVPANLVTSLINLVTVVQNAAGVEINQFPGIENNLTIEPKLSL